MQLQHCRQGSTGAIDKQRESENGKQVQLRSHVKIKRCWVLCAYSVWLCAGFVLAVKRKRGLCVAAGGAA